MFNLTCGYKLSKNKMMVYRIFQLNPFTSYDINDLLEIINRNEQIISKRTVFRIIKDFLENGRIFCCDVIGGKRRFELYKNNYYVIVCERCAKKTFGEIEDSNLLMKIHKIYGDFFIRRFHIEISGTCNKCR